MSLPAVLVISSFVVRGSVGARAAFALERLGHRVWTLPTVILPWHLGHGRSARLAVPAGDFEALAADVGRAKWVGEIGAVVTGYFASPEQVRIAADLVRAVKAANPEALHLADPVIGDDGGLYVPEAVARAQAAELLPLADIATPNRFELGWLTGLPVEDMTAIVAAARALGPARVAVTSSPAAMRGKIAAALVTAREAIVAEHPRVEGAPNGTGDLFAALLLARLLAGASDETSIASAAASTFEIIHRSVAQGSDELDLADQQAAIIRPAAMVDVRRFGTGRPRPSAG